MTGKIRIEVLDPGGLPGKTSGDIINDPTAQEIEQAKKNPTCLRLIFESGTAGVDGKREVGKDAADTSKTRRDRGNLGSDE
jgi:hypothetical protein